MKKFALFVCLITSPVYAQAPQRINFQASVNLPDTTISVRFEVFDVATGGSPLWSEEQILDIVDGALVAQLGMTEPFNDLFTAEGARYLQVTLGDDPPLGTRYQLTSVPYAMHATVADRALSAGSVLSAPDGDPAEALVVNKSGNVGMGTATPEARLHIIGTSFIAERIAENSGGPSIRFRKSRGDGVSNQKPVQNGDVLGAINWYGYFTSYAEDGDPGASILAFADGEVSASSMPTSLHFTTKPAGVAGDVTRMKINSDGNVGIGTTAPRGRLDVNGTIYYRGLQLYSDYVFQPEYELESIEEHSAFMWANKHLKAIPKARQDEQGSEIVEIGAHIKGIVEELEKAHIYIEQLNEQIQSLKKAMNEQALQNQEK